MIAIADKDIRQIDDVSVKPNGSLYVCGLSFVESDYRDRRRYAEYIFGHDDVHMYTCDDDDMYCIHSFIIWYLRHGSCLMMNRTELLPEFYDGYPESMVDISDYPVDRGIMPYVKLMPDIMYIFRDGADAAHARDIGLSSIQHKDPGNSFPHPIPGGGMTVSELCDVAGKSIHHVIIYDWSEWSIIHRMIEGSSHTEIPSGYLLEPLDDFDPGVRSEYDDQIVIGYLPVIRAQDRILWNLGLSTRIPWMEKDRTETDHYRRNHLDLSILALLIAKEGGSTWY